MQSAFDTKHSRLDTSLPSIRLLQDLIRNHQLVQIKITTGESLEGVLAWQDVNYLALRVPMGESLLMINRDSVVLVRCLR
ncbi:MAG: Hfq-related RNA-binding protein [Cyanobacteriota bacterium]